DWRPDCIPRAGYLSHAATIPPQDPTATAANSSARGELGGLPPPPSLLLLRDSCVPPSPRQHPRAKVALQPSSEVTEPTPVVVARTSHRTRRRRRKRRSVFEDILEGGRE